MQETATSLRVGDRVRVRNAVWRLRDLRRYRDCDGMDLTALDPSLHGLRRTLLWPFDRPVRLERRIAARRVGRRRAIHAATRALVDGAPWGGLRTAVEADIDIHAYQLEPALAFIRGLTTRALLADEVGLGKTIQAGLVLRELERVDEVAHVLILTPPGLRDQWVGELDRRFHLPATVVDTASLRLLTAVLPRGVNPWAWPSVIVASLDFVKRPEVVRALEGLVWDLLIVDEAHLAAGPSDRHDAVAGLAARARRVLLLTATPHGGDERAFDALCNLGRLGPPAADPLVVFRRTRAGLGLGAPRRTRVLLVHPTPAEARVHRLLERYTDVVWHEAGARHDRDALLALLVLRKRALSSAGSLAVSVERRLAYLDAAAADAVPDQVPLPFEAGGETDADDEAPGVVLAAPGLADRRRERAWVRAIAAAARLAARRESKLALLERLAGRAREPMLVFTEYRDTLERVAARLRLSTTVAVLHGGLGRAERAAAVDAFARGDARVLVATDAAGQGLNLQARCRWVVNFELPWNPVRLEQRIGRVDRLGQRRPVHATHLVAGDTAERFVLTHLLARTGRVRAALGDPDGGPFGQTELELARRLVDRPPDADAERAAPLSSAPPADQRGFERLDLDDDAVRETRRLGGLRRLVRVLEARRPGPDDPLLDAPVVALLGQRAHRRAKRSGRPMRLLLVYAASLEDQMGRAVDTVFLPVTLHLRARDGEGRQPRALVTALLAHLGAELERRVRVAVAARLETVAREDGRVLETWRRRERAIRAAIQRSVAGTLLVQPGLYDRRALRRAEASRRVDRAALEAMDRRIAGLDARRRLVIGRTGLVAALELASLEEPGP